MEEKKKGFPNLLNSRPKKQPENPENKLTGTVSNVEEARKPEPEPELPKPEVTQPPAAKPSRADSLGLTDEDKRQIYDAIDVIRRKLSFTKDFSAEEREDLIRLGKTGRRFVDKAAGLVERSPGILPRSFDVDSFNRDAELYQELGDISDELRKLSNQVDDTEAAIGSDAFSAALVVYQSGKLARTGDDMDNLLSGWRNKLNFD